MLYVCALDLAIGIVYALGALALGIQIHERTHLRRTLGLKTISILYSDGWGRVRNKNRSSQPDNAPELKSSFK